MNFVNCVSARKRPSLIRAFFLCKIVALEWTLFDLT